MDTGHINQGANFDVIENTEPRKRIPHKKSYDKNSHRISQDDGSESTEELSKFSSWVEGLQTQVTEFTTNYRQIIVSVLYAIVLLLYIAYFGYAMYYDFNKNIGLLVLTCVVVAYAIIYGLTKWLGPKITKVWEEKYKEKAQKIWRYGYWVFVVLVTIAIIVSIGVDVRHDPSRLIPVAGFFGFLFGCMLFSRDPLQISFRLIFSGMCLQMVFGLIVLRWSHGNQAFQWLGTQIENFIFFAVYGAGFVFGDFSKHEFAMLVLPTIIWFGAFTSLLYYLGIIQWAIRIIGGIIYYIMGIGPVEAFVASANIFLDPNLSVLTVAKFLETMTLSELHLVSTSGFSTVAGSLFGIYISFGNYPAHLIAASVLSAPMAIIVSKLLYPEMEESSQNNLDKIVFSEPEGKNALDAFSRGSYFALKVMGSVMVNLIAFISLLQFLNSTLGWFGGLVGFSGLSFQFIMSYLFYPLPLLMGIPPKDCLLVASLIGNKIFLTDIIGYAELGALINNRKNGLLPAIEHRSEVIATYAICGFGNLPDIGICLGAIGAIVPSRRSDLARVAVKAMVASNIACFMTACLAGLFYTGDFDSN